MKRVLFIFLGILILLVPLGLLSDAPAWGEWESEYFKEKLGFIPAGIEKVESALHLKALLPDYSLPGANDVVGYYVSALVGVLLIGALYYLIYLFVRKRA
jgi:cobalt/nickel transport protein